MTQFHSIIAAIWPQPPAGLEYVEQALSGGDYISTGLFEVGSVSPSGTGRTKGNCKQVTSLFFDADLIGLHTAVRVSEGEEVEISADARKAVLYTVPDDEIEGMKEYALEVVTEALSAVMNMDPTAIIDSGWGYHFHYAVDGFTPADHERLSTLHKAIVAEVNRRVADAASKEGLDWRAALDNTNDVGARLARFPGSMNVKCPSIPKAVEVLCGDAGCVLRPADLSGIAARCATAPRASQGSASARPATASARMEHRSVDFSQKFLNDGRSWQEAITGLSAGSRLNTICPESGSSVGSAFFVVEGDGSSKLISNAANIVWHNTYTVKVPGRATLTMKRGKDGSLTTVPEPTLTNLMNVLRHDARWNLWYDDFRQVAMNGTAPLSEHAHIELSLMLEADYQWTMNRPGKETVFDAILSVCAERKRNPVKEYLRGLAWDGEPRLDEWLWNTVFAPAEAIQCPFTVDRDLLSIYSRKWAISLVARALEPGCKCDTVLVLAGRQSFRKSTLFRTWASDECFVDQQIDTRNKDSLMVLNRAWIYEDAELASTKMSEGNSLKNFLTRQTDTFRAPYERFVKDQPRHFIIAGTTNEDSFLKDRTGDRRFWVVEVPSFPDLDPDDAAHPKADLDWLRANRDQLLAEAVALYDAGKRANTDGLWWLMDKEESKRGKSNQKFRHLSTWDEAAISAFEANRGGPDNGFAAGEFAQAIDEGLSPSQIAKIGLTLSSALTAAGFRKLPKSSGKTLWFKPIPPGTVAMKGNGLPSATHRGAEREKFSR